MTKFKKCGTTYCDYTAKKWVKVYPQDREEQIGGWKSTKVLQRSVMGGAVAIIYKNQFVKVPVCVKCYENAELEDFCIVGQDNKEMKISKVVRL